MKRNERNNDVLTCCSLGYFEWLFGPPQVKDAR